MTKFVYIQNLRIPNEFANSIYVVKICEAAQKLGYKTSLLIPQRQQPFHFKYSNIWEYYKIKKHIFHLINFEVPEFSKFPQWINFFYKHLRHQLITWVFSLKSLFYILKNKIDIIETMDREIILLLRLIFWYKPKIIYDVHINPKTFYEKLLDNLILNRVDLFMVNCQYFSNYYKNKGIYANKIIILPNGFDPSHYCPSSILSLRKTLKIPKNKFILGYIGRFETFKVEKGVDKMIKIASILKNKIPICVVAVGGPQEYVDKYKKMAINLGLTDQEAIILSQVKPEMVAKYIKCFDIACMLYPDCSHYRDKMSPMKVIEYMASGKPIIASDLPSITQILNNDIAYIINPSRQKELENVIIEIYKNYEKAKQKAEKAKLISQEYSWLERQKKIFNKLN